MFTFPHPKICANICKSICSDNDKTMGTRAVNKLEVIDISETVPIYVKVLLLNLEICANICKSICSDNDKTMGTWADIMETTDDCAIL